MRFLAALLVSLLVVSTTACKPKKWPKEVKQEMLELCIQGNTHQYWPRDPQKELRDATQACKCAVRKMEGVDPESPTKAIFREKAGPFVTNCERHGTMPDLECSAERKKLYGADWGSNTRQALLVECVNKKPSGVPDDQFLNYCQCLLVRSETAEPLRFTEADFLMAPSVKAGEFFALAKPHEELCRGTHVGENPLPLNEINMRKFAYGKIGWRQGDEDEALNIYIDRYDCASLKVRESFFRCFFTGNLKWLAEQKRLGSNKKRSPSEYVEQAVTCAKENPVSE